MVDAQQVRQVKEQHKGSILRKPNVVGVGYGYKEVGGARSGQLCLVALVRQKVPRAALAPEDMVPPQVDGVATDVIRGVVGRCEEETQTLQKPHLIECSMFLSGILLPVYLATLPSLLLRKGVVRAWYSRTAPSPIRQ